MKKRKINRIKQEGGCKKQSLFVLQYAIIDECIGKEDSHSGK